MQNTIRSLQSDLAKEKERREELQNKNQELEKQLKYSEQGMHDQTINQLTITELENLGHVKEQLKDQMKEQQILRQQLLSELAKVTKQNMDLEEEKSARTKELLAKDEKVTCQVQIAYL